MKAWQVSTAGAPVEVMVAGDKTLPSPGPGEIRIAVAAAALERVGELQMTHADNIQRIFDRLTGIAAGSAK